MLRAALETVLQEERLQASAERTLHTIANRVTASLLHLGLLEAAAFKPTPVPTEDLRELIDPVKEDFRQIRQLIDAARKVQQENAPTEHVELGSILRDLQAEYPAAPAIVCDSINAPVEIEGEARQVSRAVRQLLINAIEGDGQRGAGTIRLNLRDEGGRVRLLISDDGPGFPAEVVPRVGQPFLSTKAGHLGLGLFTCLRFAASGGRSCSVRNLPEGGAQVELVLRKYLPR